jgi:hypothetical protein
MRHANVDHGDDVCGRDGRTILFSGRSKIPGRPVFSETASVTLSSLKLPYHKVLVLPGS